MPHVNSSLVKVVAVGLLASAVAIALVSTFFRRRKRRSTLADRGQPAWIDVGSGEHRDSPDASSIKSQPGRGQRSQHVQALDSLGSGDGTSMSGRSPAPARRRGVDDLSSGSTASATAGSNASCSSQSTTTVTLGATSAAEAAAANEDALIATLTPQQVCQLGLEKLRRARALWEEALARLQVDLLTTSPLEPRLLVLLRQAQLLETLYAESELEPQATASAAPALYGSAAPVAEAAGSVPSRPRASSLLAGAVLELDRQYELERVAERRQQQQRRNEPLAPEEEQEGAEAAGVGGRRDSITSTDSSQDSYVSALEVADLSDLEEHMQAVRRQWMDESGSGAGGAAAVRRQLLYEDALLRVQQGSVPYRKLRTAVVGCSSDSEFLARLHAVRCGLDAMLKDEANRQWLLSTGKSMIGRVLEQSARDPKDFETALDSLVDFVGQPESWEITKEELLGRNVKSYTFYDIVLDFILMDAFDDLANPPASVTSVTLNRWLSNGLKETALSTAVWSVLKAKRRMLKFPRGFIAHFYSLSEQVSPALAWGFLGPDSELKEVCYAFKDQVMGFITDLFNPNKVRYTTLEEMSADIMAAARRRAAIVMSVLHNGDVLPA